MVAHALSMNECRRPGNSFLARISRIVEVAEARRYAKHLGHDLHPDELFDRLYNDQAPRGTRRARAHRVSA